MAATVEMKRNELIQMMKDVGVRGWYKIYNKADMVEAINKATVNKAETLEAGLFVEVERKDGQPIEVGMGASGTYWTDVTPFEVVRVISDKTIEIRRLEVKTTGGNWLDPEYELYRREDLPVEKVRKCKDGWKTSDGMRIYVGHARYYRDPSF